MKDLVHQATDEAATFQDDGHLRESLSSTFTKSGSGLWVRKTGTDVITAELLDSLHPLRFTPVGTDRMIIDVPFRGKHHAWLLNFNGINRVLGERAGLGMTGEIYLVGTDHLIRSASRHLREEFIKIPHDSIKLATLKKTGVHKIRDYRNKEVVSAYSPFVFDQMDLVLLSEIDSAEVIRPLLVLLPRIFLLCAGFFLLSLFLAWFGGRKILSLIAEMKSQINSLTLKILTAGEEEKRKISIDLHDGVGQIITALKWGLSQREEPEKLKGLCDTAVREIRIVSDHLMPAELKELGLFAALRHDFRTKQDFFKVEMTYNCDDEKLKQKFQSGLDVNIYRMVQELVQNTMKHSKATKVRLDIHCEKEHTLVLRYEDNGIGMKKDSSMPRVLQYRADLMGAGIKRVDTPQGLTYLIEVPMENVFYADAV
ncbi:MAG: sensor histidine kinase [Bacteriovoracaceae bacterium]